MVTKMVCVCKVEVLSQVTIVWSLSVSVGLQLVLSMLSFAEPFHSTLLLPPLEVHRGRPTGLSRDHISEQPPTLCWDPITLYSHGFASLPILGICPQVLLLRVRPPLNNPSSVATSSIPSMLPPIASFMPRLAPQIYVRTAGGRCSGECLHGVQSANGWTCLRSGVLASPTVKKKHLYLLSFHV